MQYVPSHRTSDVVGLPFRSALVLILLAAPVRAQVGGLLEDLGSLGGPGASSTAEASSWDGEVVVGDSRDTQGRRRAFRWTPATGCVDLGTLGGPEARAYDVSADGSVVVGESDRATGWPHAFVWTAATGMQGIGTSLLARSVARGCSGDGSVIVGEVGFGYGVRRRAFRWTAAGGIRDLGTLGGAWSGAWGVSADGQVVVGSSETATGEIHGFRWTAATGMQDLGVLAPGGSSVAARANADGSVLAGWGDESVPIYHALRWVNGALEDLGTLGSSATTAEDLSDDGSVVIGGGLVPAAGHQGRAFRWTQAAGFELLGTLGGNESYGNGVSGDGTTIVGGATLATGIAHAFRWRQGVGTLTCGQTRTGTCAATWTTEGAPTVAATSPYWLRAHSLPTASFAVVSYGVGPAVAIPAAYGTWCVPGTPERLAIVATGGAAGTTCDGSAEVDFNAFLATTMDPRLVAGAHVVVQLVHRDVGAPGFALLSAAVEFDVAP